jgi:predicted DNA-binding transcriptional regulator YafY
MEYYWYIVGEIEEGIEKEIRYFRMKRIVKVEILDEYFEYSEFRALYHTIKDVNKGMNAFYQPYKKSRKIKVIMPEWFEEHIKEVPYFNTWEKTGEVKIIEKARFLSYTIISTDEEYRDIIPAIQKYMPHIVVCNNKENQELIELMRIRSQKYARIFEGS